MINVIMDFMPFSRSFLCFHGRLAREGIFFTLQNCMQILVIGKVVLDDDSTSFFLSFIFVTFFSTDSKTTPKGFNLLPAIKKQNFSLKFFFFC